MDSYSVLTEENFRIGSLVKRNKPNWVFGIQDCLDGEQLHGIIVGEVFFIYDRKWVKVRWSNGYTNEYLLDSLLIKDCFNDKKIIDYVGK